MGSHGLADEALAWLQGLDPGSRKTQPVPLAMANLQLARTNWTGLEVLLEHEQWQDLEFLRLAYLARAAQGQGRTLAGEARWRGAIRDAGAQLGPLTLLFSLATEWNLQCEDLLWQICRRFPREHWALFELEKGYLASGNTRGLHRVYAALLSSTWTGADSTNRNNFATCSMLLKVNLPEAHQIARELYLRQPTDAVIASTYAYSLHLQGRTKDGLAVLEKLRPESRETPPVALYYGVLLSAAGDGERVGHYLAIAKSVPLLPEEQELLAKAADRPGRAGVSPARSGQ